MDDGENKRDLDNLVHEAAAKKQRHQEASGHPAYWYGKREEIFKELNDARAESLRDLLSAQHRSRRQLIGGMSIAALLLITAGTEGTIRVWNLQLDELIRQAKEFSAPEDRIAKRPQPAGPELVKPQ